MALGAFAPLPLPLGGTATDGWTAEQHARLCADLVAIVQTAPFAVLSFTMGTAAVQRYAGQHGVGLAHAPTVSIVGVGDMRFTWSADYTDDYGYSRAPRFRWVNTNAMSGADVYAQWLIEAPNVVRVRHYNGVNNPVDGTINSLVVY